MSETVETTAVKKYEVEGNALVIQAHSIKVFDQATREQATAFVAQAARAVKEIKARFEEPKRKADEAHKAIVRMEKDLCDRFVRAKSIVDAEINRDWQEQEQKRREAERKAREEAEERERKERERLQRLAEKQAAAGKVEKAEATLARVEEVCVPVINPAPENSRTTRTDYGTTTVVDTIDAAIIDPMEVVRAIVMGHLPVFIVNFDIVAIKKIAKSTGAKELPGIKITRTTSLKTRSI